MRPRKPQKRHKRYNVLALDNVTREAITARFVFARDAGEAGNIVGEWLDLEGFNVEVRLEIYELDD
jgi:hypothetical protein